MRPNRHFINNTLLRYLGHVNFFTSQKKLIHKCKTCRQTSNLQKNKTIRNVCFPTPEEDLQSYKRSLVKFRHINSGSRINCGQIATFKPKILLRRILVGLTTTNCCSCFVHRKHLMAKNTMMDTFFTSTFVSINLLDL